MKYCHLQQHGWTWGYHTKWSKSKKDKYQMISLICRLLKIIQINSLMKQEKTHTLRECPYGYQRGRGFEG